jgi:hypothetical protein
MIMMQMDAKPGIQAGAGKPIATVFFCIGIFI